MKNPKLIDEAWLETQAEFNSTNKLSKYQTGYIEAIRAVICRLQPMKTNVEKIRSRELAIENDKLNSLRKCLKHCFPKVSAHANGGSKFYFAHPEDLLKWYGLSSTVLPTIKASELIKEIEKTPEPTEWQPKFGEVVEVSDNEVYWCKSIYLFTEYGKHHCVHGLNIDNFKNVETYTIITWYNIRPVQKPTLTRAEADKIKSRIDELKSELAEAEAKLNCKIVD